MLSTELVAVQKNLTLEMDANQYNETEVRIRLSELYGIAPERISLDMSAGSVQLVVTFLPSASSGTDAAASNSSVADSLPALMSAVEVRSRLPAPCRVGFSPAPHSHLSSLSHHH